MTAARWIWRGLWHFRGSYAGVLAGCALASMVLLGALLAGDSMEETLRRNALARLGKVDVVLDGGGRWFRAALAGDLAADGLLAAPVLRLRGEVTVADGGRALGGVQVLGIDENFFRLAPESGASPPPARGFHINSVLADRLSLKPGESLVLRFAKPGAGMTEVPMSGPAPEPTVLRGEVGSVLDERNFGCFGLENTQMPQATVIVPLERLQTAVEQPGMANLLLLHTPEGAAVPVLADAVRSHCTAADYGLDIEELPLAKAVELRTKRVFFDRPLAAAIQKALPAARPVITYLANTISAAGRSTPYSMVTAVDPAAAPFLPPDFNGVAINSWLADDLGAKLDDEIRLDYYAVDETNRLVERNATLRVVAVVPLEGLAADPKWMPEFPGIASAENTSDWDAGVPIDVKRVRDKDEAYWDERRGTPKLFLPLATGREWFGNRWGEFTALRVPGTNREQVLATLLETLTPADAGLMVRDARGEALAAAASPVDFAGLLLGMSLYLMAASVALAAMLFRFHLEQRNRESALLATLGVPPSRVLWWRLGEGLGVVAAGGAVGAVLALGYTWFLLGSLAEVWTPGGGRPVMRVDALTLLLGLTVFSILMLTAVWLVTRRQVRQAAALRLEAESEEIPPVRAPGRPWGIVMLAIAGGLAAAASSLLGPQGAFFLCGCCLLAAGLGFFRRTLLRRQRTDKPAPGFEPTVRWLASLNCARRPTRSVVVAGTLAAGVFLVVSVAAFRKQGDDWSRRAGPTGGYALWAETTLPGGRPNNPDADPANLGEARHRFGEILPVRVGPGDDASCLNLNQVARPRLLGIDSAALERRGAFTIKRVLDGLPRTWAALRGGDVTRAFVDESTLLWVLKMRVGDRVVYQDDWGREYPVEIAGTLEGSVFQGSFIVDEVGFLKHHPQAGGPRIFLLDAEEPLAGPRAILRHAMADRGVIADTTAARMAAFHGVENSYIRVFHMLGGLGVILGSAGLGVLTARNLSERRREFAILHTVGVPAAVVRRVALAEAARLAGWGLALGLGASLVAILPGLGVAGLFNAMAWLVLLGGLVALNGWFWSWLACRRYFRASFTTLADRG